MNKSVLGWLGGWRARAHQQRRGRISVLFYLVLVYCRVCFPERPRDEPGFQLDAWDDGTGAKELFLGTLYYTGNEITLTSGPTV